MRIGRVVFVAILALLPLQLIESQALASDNCLVLNSRQYLQASTKLIPVTSDFTIEFDFYLNKGGDYSEFISQGSKSFPFFLGITPLAINTSFFVTLPSPLTSGNDFFASLQAHAQDK